MTGKLLASIGMIVTTGYMWAFETEVVNYGDWKLGKRENAIISSVCSFAVALGLALGGVVPGYFLKFIGFNASLKMQTASTLHGILTMQLLLPLIFIIAGMILFIFYPITDSSMNKMSAEIDARNKRLNKNKRSKTSQSIQENLRGGWLMKNYQLLCYERDPWNDEGYDAKLSHSMHLGISQNGSSL